MKAPIRRVTGCQRIDGGADCLVLNSCEGCGNAIFEEKPLRGLGKLIAALQAEMEKNGDAEHVALGFALLGDTPSRMDAYGEIEVVTDHANYPNGMVFLVADYEVLPPPKRIPRKKRQSKQAGEKVSGKPRLVVADLREKFVRRPA